MSAKVDSLGEAIKSLFRILQNRDGWMVSLSVCCLLGASQLLPEQGGLLACGRWQVCLSLVAVSAVWWFGKEEQRNLSFLVVSFQSDRLKHRHPTQTCPP